MNPLEKIHQDSSYHKEALNEAEQGSCFYCFSKFSTEKITEWYDEGQTAICPNCGIDSVLPGDVASGILDHMYRRWVRSSSINIDFLRSLVDNRV